MEDQKLLELFRYAVREELQPVQQQLIGLDQRMERVEERLDRVDERFDIVEQRLDRLDERFNQMEDRIGIMEQNIYEKLNNISTESRSEAKHLTRLHNRQQKVIELLANRSIEHEADIRSMKQLLSNQ